MVRHLFPDPEPIPSFWRASIKLGKTTELEYYKYILPRDLKKEFVESYRLLRSYIMRFYNMDEKYKVLNDTIIPALEQINSVLEKYEAMINKKPPEPTILERSKQFPIAYSITYEDHQKEMKELISEFEKCLDWIEFEYNEQGNISISHYIERVREIFRGRAK